MPGKAKKKTLQHGANTKIKAIIAGETKIEDLFFKMPLKCFQTKSKCFDSGRKEFPNDIYNFYTNQ